MFLYQPTQLTMVELEATATQPGWRLDTYVDATTHLNGLVRPATDDLAPWLLYFPGNAMSLTTSQQVLQLLAGNKAFGLATWAYRGYDGSAGEPMQPELLADALRLVAHLHNHYGMPVSRLVPVGQSLGSGIATYVASALSKNGTPPLALILVSPYLSMLQVFDEHVPLIPAAWFVADPYPTQDWWHAVTGEVLIIHGDKDNVIDIAHAEKLANLPGPAATLVKVAGAGHNNVLAQRQSLDAIGAFLDKVAF